METLRVLIADDEMGMRMGVSRILRSFSVRVPDVEEDVSFTVEQAETGEEALAIIRRQAPDILLLDHKMPGMSGLDVLAQLAGMSLDMLTVMITAYATIETAVTATKQGAYDFLAKPFTPEELKTTIRKAAARIVLARQTRKLAEEKRQVRFQFIRVLGHELKAPLNAVDGYLRLIADQTLGSDVGAYAEAVGRSLVRIDGMRKLIADLLDMTHIESGQRRRQLEPLDLVESAQAAAATAAPAAAERQIMIAIDASAPVPIVADRSEIDMILNNLVSNAVKYNRAGGRVSVELGCQGGVATIAVRDTGIGMTTDEVTRLFGEFVRIRNEKTQDILGSGLGLSIVKKLAQLYAGEVLVESQPDVGSTFTVRLSVRPSESPSTPDIAAPAEPIKA